MPFCEHLEDDVRSAEEIEAPQLHGRERESAQLRVCQAHQAIAIYMAAKQDVLSHAQKLHTISGTVSPVTWRTTTNVLPIQPHRKSEGHRNRYWRVNVPSVASCTAPLSQAHRGRSCSASVHVQQAASRFSTVLHSTSNNHIAHCLVSLHRMRTRSYQLAGPVTAHLWNRVLLEDDEEVLPCQVCEGKNPRAIGPGRL